IFVKVKKNRNTKLGDFCINREGKNVISINNNLNKYSFLITLTHELAHAFVWNNCKKNIPPHGKEWKQMYKRLMLNFLTPNIFPEDIIRVLSNHLINPKASTVNDYKLTFILRKYNKEQNTTISEIPVGGTFSINSGRKFIKLKKLRKRYQCKAIDSERIYLFNPLTEVDLLDS
ncbi:uncharacterized protein METZ01_LOCUS327503, partial [marine metagenome]